MHILELEKKIKEKEKKRIENIKILTEDKQIRKMQKSNKKKQRIEHVKQKMIDTKIEQQKRESQFLQRLREKEQKIAKLHQERYEHAKNIMEQNLTKELVKHSRDQMDRESDTMIEAKLQSFQKEYEDKVKKKNQQLHQIICKNSGHMELVKERLKDLKKAQEKDYIENIGRLLMDKKKRDKLLKERKKQIKEYRSISAFRKRDVSYDEPKTAHTPRYMQKDFQVKMQQAEGRIRKKEEELLHKMKVQSELNRLKEENLKKNSERYKKLEKIRKNEIISKMVEKEFQFKINKMIKSSIELKRDEVKEELKGKLKIG